MNRRYSLTLDLKDDKELIEQYDIYHKKVWPEIIDSIKVSGITEMEIYRKDTRLFMIMEVNESFSFEKKKELDEANPIVQEWEHLMWKFQQPVPGAPAGSKW